MKTKQILSLITAAALSLSSFTALAANDNPGDLLIMPSPVTEKANGITVLYSDEQMTFDVNPIIENNRTLVPFRAIFEIMGCAVEYTVDDEGKKIVSARRGDDNLLITIGEDKMFFSGEEIALDCPAKIKDNRTLVPIRAITEAFECEVLWDGDTKTVSIYPPVKDCAYKTAKLSETVKDDEGNILIEAVAYYPQFEKYNESKLIDEINKDFKFYAENFIESALEEKANAENMLKEMGKENFTPFVFTKTFEDTYNNYGVLSITNYSYINMGGAHPTTDIESYNYDIRFDVELPLAEVLDEEYLEGSLTDYVTDLFVQKLDELDYEPEDMTLEEYVTEYIGYVQFKISPRKVTLYFNQGILAPYALGVIEVDVPYSSDVFYINMRHDLLDEFVLEYEDYDHYRWVLVDYSENNLEVSENFERYSDESRLSEYFPIGMKSFTAKGTKPGNASITIACVLNGQTINTTEVVLSFDIYIDKDLKLTVVAESDDLSLVADNNSKVVTPLPASIDAKNLEDCTVAVSLKEGDAFVDDNGKMQMKLGVYSYDIYDMVDIAELKEGDILVSNIESVKITSIERLDTGIVRINGGEEMGGLDLMSDESTVYYEFGMNDAKAYYQIGEVTLPVSTEFIYSDESDLETTKEYYPGDFLTDEAGITYDFIPNNTSVVIEDGNIVEMTKVYIP